MFMGLYPSSVSWIHCSWTEHLPRIQIYQLCLLLCPEILPRPNLKNACPFGLNFLMFSSPGGVIFPVRKWDKIKKTQTYGRCISYSIDASSLGKHFHPDTSISITPITNWTKLDQFSLVSVNPSSALLLNSC